MVGWEDEGRAEVVCKISTASFVHVGKRTFRVYFCDLQAPINCHLDMLFLFYCYCLIEAFPGICCIPLVDSANLSIT